MTIQCLHISSDKFNNRHTYQYNANGNLTYVATGRKMKDGHTEDLISERNLLWDDENTLMAISDNGYVSSYLYDASGERTVKLSGYNEAVFVNADTAGNIVTQTNKFTIYPDAYNVYSSNGRRTKHIYIGSERIASTVSADTTYNPIIVTWAGGENFSSEINSKYCSFTNGVADIYSEFELPYNGSDNNNFIPAQVMSLASGVEVASADTGNDFDEYDYFYHSDHLGSTSYVTDANGKVSQHVEYVPFGEIFVESDSLSWDNPYLFNGKELDEETGLYYYGARYYDPRTSLWLSTDPLELKYPNVSTYCYTLNNPIKFIDLEGLSPIYNKSGDFLGTSNEGFTGNILIYDGSERVNFSQMTEQHILDNMVVFLYDEISQNIDNDVKSKIWTHVVSHFEGMLVYDEIFSLSELTNNKISYKYRRGSNWVTNMRTNEISGSGHFKNYEATVENIASSIIVHEWYSHVKKRNHDNLKSHRLAYKNVINFKKLWNKTTDKYKSFNLKQLLNYTKRETGRNNVDPLYRRLFNKYVK